MPTQDSHQLPTSEDFLWPTLKALEDLGGSASNQELFDRIVQKMELSDEVLEVRYENSSQPKVSGRAAWARTDLRLIGAIDNTARGVWTITEVGREIQTEEQVIEMVREDHKRYRQQRAQGTSGENGDGEDNEGRSSEDDAAEELSWQTILLDCVCDMCSSAFERLCQRILRGKGFTRVEVTGGSGDEGIDGAGVLRVELISFRVVFQCKRYTGSVSASQVRDFRGAMVGRADKGLFITTGRFTSGARQEAVRDGAPTIDLIDGNDLCELLKELELGVEIVQDVRPKPEFFENL